MAFPTTRPHRSLLVLLLVGLALAAPLPTADARPTDRPTILGTDPEPAYALASQADLFGRFHRQDGTIDGQFLRFHVDAAKGGLRGITYRNEPLLNAIEVRIPNATVAVDGPVALVGNDSAGFALHDNRYAWITFGGPTEEMILRFPSGTSVEAVPEGLTASVNNRTLRLFYDGPGSNNVSMDGATARIRPQTGHLNITITLGTGIHGHGTVPGSWTLFSHVGTTTVIDMLRPTQGRHTVTAVATEQLGLFLAPLPTEPGRDAAHRLETVGAFPPDIRLVVGTTDGILFREVNETSIFAGPRAVAWKNATERGPVTTILLRQPFGLSGNVTLRHDGVAPAFTRVEIHNLTDFWRPVTQRPFLRVESDEPVTARFKVDGAPPFAAFIVPALRHDISLAALEPDRSYPWSLTIIDLAGNTNTTNGTLRTPVDPEILMPRVRVTTPHHGQHFAAGEDVYLNATVDDGAGRSLPPPNVTILVDGRPVDVPVRWEGTRMTTRLGLLEDGPHEVRVVARGYAPQNLGSDSVTFTVGVHHMAPGPALIALVGVLLAALAWIPRSGADLHRVEDALQRRDRRE